MAPAKVDDSSTGPLQGHSTEASPNINDTDEHRPLRRIVARPRRRQQQRQQHGQLGTGTRGQGPSVHSGRISAASLPEQSIRGSDPFASIHLREALDRFRKQSSKLEQLKQDIMTHHLKREFSILAYGASMPIIAVCLRMMTKV